MSGGGFGGPTKVSGEEWAVMRRGWESQRYIVMTCANATMSRLRKRGRKVGRE
jgi:hypothetical protein